MKEGKKVKKGCSAEAKQGKGSWGDSSVSDYLLIRDLLFLTKT